MKKTIVIALAGVVALGSSVVTAGPMHGPGSDLKEMLRAVELTREQKQDIRELMQMHREDAALTDTDERGFRDKWQPQGSFDETAFRAEVASRTATMRAKQFERAELRHDIYQLLTTEQRNTIEQQDIEQQQKRSQKREKMDENPLPRAFEKLSLTDAQEQELTTLQTAFKEESAKGRALMKAFREKEKALIRSDNFSESAWTTLADSYQQDMTDAMVAHAKHKASMLSVLDESQQQELLAMYEERRDRHHHGKPHRR